MLLMDHMVFAFFSLPVHGKGAAWLAVAFQKVEHDRNISDEML